MSQQFRLRDFNISEKNAFLPPEPPLRRLPGEYFSSWEDTCTRISDFIKNQLLRAKIDALPEREFNKETLKTEQEWQRAYVLLTFLSQAYIWAEGEAGVIDKLPKKLAVPWCTVSEHEHVTLKPVCTYASVVSYNYALKDPSHGMVLDNLVAISSFTGIEDESWFYMVHVIVELAAAPGLAAIPRVYEAMAQKQNNVLTKELQIVEKSIKDMREKLKCMYERCCTSTFYVSIRPFLSGTEGNKAFPNGLIYEGVDSEPRFYNGGSAAETTTIPSFDALLGVKHPPPEGDFIMKIRKYQPKKHREFLEYINKNPSVRDYIEHSKDPELIMGYNSVLDALIEFRSGHLKLVTMFIVNENKKQVESSEGTPVDALKDTGTGGTPLNSFLKNLEENTKQCKIY